MSAWCCSRCGAFSSHRDPPNSDLGTYCPECKRELLAIEAQSEKDVSTALNVIRRNFKDIPTIGGPPNTLEFKVCSLPGSRDYYVFLELNGYEKKVVLRHRELTRCKHHAKEFVGYVKRAISDAVAISVTDEVIEGLFNENFK